jgi:hypothetical protein
MRRAGVKPDERLAEAIALVESKRGEDGRWLLENPHEGKIAVNFGESVERPSRWITLKALRVLDWYSK